MADDLKTDIGVKSTLGLRPGETPIWDPEKKELLAVPDANVKRYLDAGRQLATFEQLQERAMEKVYGNREIVAGGLGAARGLTFGLSDLAARGLGEEEFVREIKKRNEGASLGGEALGIALPLLFSAGTGALAKGAQVGGVGVLGAARAGRAAEGALASAMARAGENVAEASLARQIALKALPKALGSATEGAFYGAGQAISEEALGDHELAADKFLTHVGLNALLGAGIGGGIGAAVGAGGAIIPKISVKDLVRKLPQTKIESLQKQANEIRMEIAKTATPDDMQTLDDFFSKPLGTEEGAAYRKSLISADSPIQREKYVKEFSNELTNLHGDFQSQIDDFYKTIRPAERKSLLSKGIDAEEARQKVHGLVQESWLGAVDKIKSRPDLYTQAYGSKLEQILEPITKELQDPKASWSALKLYERTEEAKRLIDDMIPYGKSLKDLPLPDREAAMVVKGIAGNLRSFLEDQTVWGKAGARQATINHAYADLSNLTGKKGLFRKYFMSDIGGKFEIDPAKIDTFLKGADKGRYQFRQQAFEEYVAAMNKMTDAMAEGFEKAKADPSSLFDFAQAAGKSSEQMRKLIDSSQRANQLSRLRWYEWQNQALTLGGMLKGAASKSINTIINRFTKGVGGEIRESLKTQAIGDTLLKKLQHISELERRWTGIDRIADKATTIFGASAAQKRAEKIMQLEKIGNQVSKTIDGSVDSFLNNKKTGQPGWVGELSVPIGTVMGLESSDLSDDIAKRSEELASLMTDQQILQDRLSSSLHDTGLAAPNLTATVVRKAADAVAFLNGKMPRSPFGPTDKIWRPSDYERAKFERYYAATLNPLSVMADLEKGVMNIESFEALKTIHPGLYAEVSQKLMDKLAEMGDRVPYDKRVLASMIFETPLEKTMSPSFIASIQSMYAQQEQQRQLAAPPRRGVKTQSAQREATQFTRVQNRGG